MLSASKWAGIGLVAAAGAVVVGVEAYQFAQTMNEIGWGGGGFRQGGGEVSRGMPRAAPARWEHVGLENPVSQGWRGEGPRAGMDPTPSRWTRGGSLRALDPVQYTA